MKIWLKNKIEIMPLEDFQNRIIPKNDAPDYPPDDPPKDPLTSTTSKRIVKTLKIIGLFF